MKDSINSWDKAHDPSEQMQKKLPTTKQKTPRDRYTVARLEKGIIGSFACNQFHNCPARQLRNCLLRYTNIDGRLWGQGFMYFRLYFLNIIDSLSVKSFKAFSYVI